ncbi:MAG: acyltransferase family protein [Pseudomonadota bacterium]
MEYRNDLQGLRAIAIILVVLAHSGLGYFSGGFVGVDVFFVLSGFLITGLICSEIKKTGKLNIARFYSRRLSRLLPALGVMLVVTLIVVYVLFSPKQLHSQLLTGLFSSIWLSNVFFYFREVDYFDEYSKHDLFLHTWSLGVEEQFYLVWPFALLFLVYFGKKNSNHNLINRSVLLTGLALIFAYGFSLYLSETNIRAAFYLMPSRVWQFSLGALVFLLSDNQSLRFLDRYNLLQSRNWYWVIWSLGLTLVVGSALLLTPTTHYPGVWATVPSVGAACIIFSGKLLRDNNPLVHPLLVWIGDRSYSWYLWHWPVLTIGLMFGLSGQVLATAGLIAISLLLAMLSYRFVETPFTKGRCRGLIPRRVLLYSMCSMLALCAIFFHARHDLDRAIIADDFVDYWRRDSAYIYKIPCDGWYYHAKVDKCNFGTEDAEKTVVLLGDSIGAQWFSMVLKAFPSPEWLTTVLTKSACPIVDEQIYYQRVGGVFRICEEWRSKVIQELEVIKPDVIVLGSSSSYEFGELQWTEGSSRIFERLSRAADFVIVLAATPRLNFDGPACINLHVNLNGLDNYSVESCMSDSDIAHASKVAGLLTNAADRYHNVHLVDLSDLVCPNQRCYAGDPDTVVVFRDSQHLTDTFVRTVAPEFRNRLSRLGIDLNH